MLDLRRLQSIRIHERPRAHKVVGSIFLAPSYTFPRRTKIIVEGDDKLPDESAILAINHTDRYNYWPLQYWMWRKRSRFTATWVKGKYYENRFVSKFMELTNNIPAPSKGYILTRDFVNVVGRRPSDEEYAAMSELSKGKDSEELQSAVPEELLSRKRDLLGREFDSERESYGQAVQATLAAMREQFVELNREAFEKKLHLIIFPQGTRSIRLTPGHIGIVQAALHFQKDIVPIGCSGCDRIYPGGNPWARGGTVTYRIGETIPYSEFSHLRDESPDMFATPSAEGRPKLQGVVDMLMQRINGLVDEEYQFPTGSGEEEKRQADRFL